MKEKNLFILLFLFHLTNYAQDSFQLIRGRITDDASGCPVTNALITLQGITNKSLYTDSTGCYNGKISPGHYSILVQCAGYKSEIRSNVVVLSGKQKIQDFELEEFRVELKMVPILSNSIKEDVLLDLWNIQRFAAVFYDPARAVNAHSGLINTDDQANNISVHGASPNFIQWKIEGVEIVNPNHLENAGTINDRPSLNGGGVSLFSNQLLQNSAFHFSPFDPSMGNALSGIFDMKLRNGNNAEYERTLQASLLGIDFSMEGPLSKKSSSSFLVNYRYSTIGLLSKLGVNFGGDKINYQDLSFVLALPHQKGQLKIFSISGMSETIFDGAIDTLKIETQKDLQNIEYHSKTSINGISYVHTLNNTLFIRSIAAYSVKYVSRSSSPTGIILLYLPAEKDMYEQQKFSGLTYISKRMGNWLKIKAGSHYNYFINRMFSSAGSAINADGIIRDPGLQPFISLEGTVLEKVDIKAGLHSLYQIRLNDFSLQPRFLLQYNFSERQDISFNYGRSAQTQPFYLCLGNPLNQSLKPATSNSFSVNYHVVAMSLDFKSEFYLNYFARIPVNKANNFSAFNYFNENIWFPLEQTGKARIYGFDLTIEKNMNNYYVIASSGIFKSQYSIENTYYEGRYNTKYNCALTAGKEYPLKNKEKLLSSDVRLFIRNGFKEPKNNQNEYYIYNSTLPSYWRVDLRLSYRRNKAGSTAIWALDIQNVTNRKNIAYHYNDVFTQKEETRYQLGIIPVLSYKLYF